MLASRATCPALLSVALRDETCPPPGVFACYSRYGGPKEIIPFEWNDHERGEAFLRLDQAA